MGDAEGLRAGRQSVRPPSDEMGVGVTNCLITPSDAVRRAPMRMSETVESLLGGNVAEARRHAVEIDRPALWTYWFAAGVEWQGRHSAQAHASGDGRQSAPNRAVVSDVFARDGWRCRYCGIDVVDSQVARQIGRLLPDVFPWGNRTANSHPATCVLIATPDHVEPAYAGGTNSPDNLVTSCGVCQYNKGSCTLGELGLADPRGPAIDSGWDGLSGYVEALSALPDPEDPPPSPFDCELEYLVAYGGTSGMLPKINDEALVQRLVAILERAITADADDRRRES